MKNFASHCSHCARWCRSMLSELLLFAKAQCTVPFLVALTTSLLVFGLGAWGFASVPKSNGQGLPLSASLLDASYRSLQLFFVQFSYPDSKSVLPWSQAFYPSLAIETARWLAPPAAAIAFLTLAHALFRSLRRKHRLFFCRDHTIVCGAGENGSAICQEILAREGCENAGKLVVVDLQESVVEELQRRGAIGLVGDARLPQTLERARLDCARRLVCAAGDDAANVAIALTAAGTLRGGEGANKLEIFAHVRNQQLRDLLQRHRALEFGVKSEPRIRVFNRFRNAARAILDAHPLEMDNSGRRRHRVHLILFALGPLEKALALQAALVGHYRNEQRVKLHLVGDSAAEHMKELVADYPMIRECIDICPHEEQGSAISRVVNMVSEFKAEDMATLFLGDRDPQNALVEVLLLKERLESPLGSKGCLRVLLSGDADPSIKDIVKLPREKLAGFEGVEEQVPGSDASLADWVFFGPSSLMTSGEKAVFDYSLDAVAREVHATWLKTERQSGVRKATRQEWENLTEDQKDANRAAADHVKVKIRAMDCDPGDISRPDKKEDLLARWDQLTSRSADEAVSSSLRELGRMEHRFWCAQRWLTGWKHAEERNDALRRHPDLVDYDKLSPDVQELDHEQVRRAVDYLELAVRSPL